ncbi:MULTISPECIES: glutamine-hydrolyzing carbamoyl-phosphate synthase small subunit [unclassified Mesorhizobium]|uniref:glutamine-hydrolyzing carbamoyl-phosphate synthase small subunit n=1 Tax=unclassified Mesorhizobium TaxID=325217 RepID=UPI001091ED29|nr:MULTISPECIES: glutamine-hydrolyzing carbamoyl-phosphate synthase small subunit [unclassified Mesorhizobium]TGP87323.1 glutamine-hydrolyzing carbamoyl-phosphate synthase small subunit [Mesorhizobium sp. M8A.F.Ca.ET.218.01.1.1]TGS48830.1 glutamine-hydrolyzing carbamoyl-phosphate synthase small subunit [Mesorhizobium sp. M8A.F.Ca.ET.182.01.1.1]TGS82879.1 glutamine-hydrolyzing carbamoyl-phosphate synthase small subunit [Mesorhizobium sp. M8A.F.Ca.ET.181.01.1.1]TGT15342.1 glutamine-hydrolyzing ca
MAEMTPALTPPWATEKPTALLVLADGTVIEGRGLGATGSAVAEVCFNTALTGYQEILTDPSYAGQIVTFTFPHIGNIGTNGEDIEDLNPAARAGAVGAVFKADVTNPSNYRAAGDLDQWLKKRGIVALSGIDTRALTALIREKGMANAVIAHAPDGVFDLADLKRRAAAWSGLIGLDLAKEVTSGQSSVWRETPWVWNEGFGEQDEPSLHVVAIDYGVKRNILRLLAGLGAKVTVVPASTGSEEILAMQPDGIFLSNGPGDPEATGDYAVPVIQDLLKTDIPVFGICLGHQMLALALGGKTAKMHQGHHGANHPVKDHTTGKVEIVSMNHGFAVDADSLPAGVEETHVSLFDGSNCGIALTGRPVFSVQHHPEASPGPQDSHYLFRRFVNLIRQKRGEELLAERA